MNNYVGYLVRKKDGLYGERGLFYDYVLASNGVFIEAEGPLLAARVPVIDADIRGLAPLEPKVVLRYGLIPQRFFDLALSTMLTDISQERYVAITWNDGYHLHVPEQDRSGGGVKYQVTDKVVIDLHSHGRMPAWFSDTDDKDELGLKLYGVIGKLNRTPHLQLRVGVYGYFHPISWGEVFSGTLSGVIEGIEEEIYLDDGKEVIEDHELHCLDRADEDGCGHRRGRLWWDRFVRR